MPRGQRNGAPKGAPQAPAVSDAVGASAVESHKEPIAVAPPAAGPAYDYDSLSAADRENPERLQGEDLRRLAHQRGISRSESGRMSDQKLREQLRFISYRQYDR